MAVCYRHPSRETGVSCSSCGRPICPDCMTPTPVGMRCPECSRERTKVQRARQIGAGRRPGATQILIAINVIVFLAEVAAGAHARRRWRRDDLEPRRAARSAADRPNPYPRRHGTTSTGGWSPAGSCTTGSSTSASTCFRCTSSDGRSSPRSGAGTSWRSTSTSLLAGSFGALLFQPDAPTIGASGAIFGVFGALIVVARYRGIPIWQSGLGFILLDQPVFSLTVQGISIGGHVGGLVGRTDHRLVRRRVRRAPAQAGGGAGRVRRRWRWSAWSRRSRWPGATA